LNCEELIEGSYQADDMPSTQKVKPLSQNRIRAITVKLDINIQQIRGILDSPDFSGESDEPENCINEIRNILLLGSYHCIDALISKDLIAVLVDLFFRTEHEIIRYEALWCLVNATST